MNSRKITWLSATAVIGMSVAGAAWGDDAQTTQPAAAAPSGASNVGAVVVTARRRAEDVQKVPLEVSVVTPKQIISQHLLYAQDVANMVSGLEADSGQSSSPPSRSSTYHFAIRGQSGATGVVTYFDEVPNYPNAGLTDANAAPQPIFDMSNIQVLKGPQGTLFGDVTTGGAVLLQPQLPTNDFNGYVDVRSGSYAANDVEFGLGGPIVPDMLSFRVAGATHTGGNFTKDLENGATGDGQDNQELRGTLKLDVGRFEDVVMATYFRDADPQELKILLRAIPTEADGTPSVIGEYPLSFFTAAATAAGVSCPAAIPNCTLYNVLSQELAKQQGLGHYQAYENDFGETAVTETAGVINTASFKPTDWLTLRDIFSYSESQVTSPGDDNQDGQLFPLIDEYVQAGQGPHTITNEFQAQAQPVEPLHLVSGFFYSDQDQPYYVASVVAQVGSQYEYYQPSRSEYALYGGYGQADWKIIPRLTLTFGLRYTATDAVNWAAPTITPKQLASGVAPYNTLPTQMLEIPGNVPGLIVGPNVANLPGQARSEVMGHRLTYTAALDYEFTDHISGYVTTRTGYKPGGFNNQAPAGYQNYGPEDVTDYEVGVKTRWSDGEFSGTTNLALYWDNYSNIQRSVVVGVGNNNFVEITQNVAAATIRGFDLDVSGSYKAFDLTGYLSLTDAYYTKYPNTGQFDTSKCPSASFTPTCDQPYSSLNPTTQPLSDVSKWRWGLTPSIHFNRLGLSEDVVLSADVYYRSKFSIANSGVLSPEYPLPGRTIVNLRLDWNKVRGSNVGLAVGVMNVTNYQGLIEVNDLETQVGYADGEYNPPRTGYVELHYSF